MDRVPLFACLHVTLRGCTSCGCMLCKQGVYYPPRVRERASLAYAGVACGVRFVAPSCAPVALMRVVRLRFRDCLRKDCVCFDARGCDFPRRIVKIDLAAKCEEDPAFARSSAQDARISQLLAIKTHRAFVIPVPQAGRC